MSEELVQKTVSLCAECKKEFMVVNAWQKFCTNACGTKVRMRRYHAKKAQKQKETPVNG